MSRLPLFLTLGLLASSTAFAASPEAAFLAEHGLAGKSVEQIVDTIDQTPQSRPLPYSASITSTELKLASDGQMYTLPLGEKSISPLRLTNNRRTRALTTAFPAVRVKCRIPRSTLK